jgi:hypothetical protein
MLVAPGRLMIAFAALVAAAANAARMRLTEAGDTRVTEDGDRRILES